MAHHFASGLRHHGRHASPVRSKPISGRSSRFAAMQMDIGNLVSMLLPPLPILWFGGSMLIYALHRHHPDPRSATTPNVRPTASTVMGRSSRSGLFPGRGITPWLIAWGLDWR